MRLPRPLVIAIASIVALLWATNVVIGFVDPGRSVAGLNVIFGMIVGSAFALDNPVTKRVAQLLKPPSDDTKTTDQGSQP